MIAAQLANEADAMAAQSPKKRPLGIGHFFNKIKKQRSEEHVFKDEDSQHVEGLLDVKDEEVKQEEDDMKDGDKHLPQTPQQKYTRDDYVRWGKKGGRPSSSTKKTPTSLQKLITRKASKDELDEQTAMNKERYRNARDGAREKQRRELALKDRLVIAEFMEECIKKHNMKTHKGKHQFWEEVEEKYKVSRKRLQMIWQGREKDKELKEEKKHEFKKKRFIAQGVRAPGGGRKSIYEFTLQELDDWIHAEYSCGHQMDKADVLDEWMSILAKKTMQMMIQDEKGVLPEEDKHLLEQYKQKLLILAKNNNNRKETMKWLTSRLEMEELMPSRTTSLTPDEELEGCINTWGMWDRVLWMAAFGNEKQLSTEIADPKTWDENKAQTVIVMEDEVPVWIKMGISKKVVPRTHARHQRAVKRVRGKMMKTKSPKMRSVLMSSLGDGMAQLRNKQVGDEKFRITVVLRQAILHYFDESKKPVGLQLPPIVVMPGVHARINNISKDGTWVEDEIIKVGQKTIIRKK